MTDLMKNKLEKVLDELTSPALFVTAIEWYRKELWNDAGEILPREGDRILVKYGSDIYSGKFISSHFSAGHWVYSIQTKSNELKNVFTRKWTLVEDILPEKED